MDQHRLALGRIGALEQIGPDGEQSLGHRRRLDHRQRLGHRQALAGRRQRIFGIAAARDQGADRLADHLPGDTFSGGGDLARHLEAGD